MRKLNLFNFLEKKVNTAEISTVTAQMIEQAAFKELALHICVSYIANTLSKCEIKTYENGKEAKGLLYYRLNVSPNPNQNASQFINQIIENYFYKFGSLAVMHDDYFYCADNFDVDDANPLKEYRYSNVSFNCQQVKKQYKASEVLHFRLDNQNVKTLVDLLYAQYSEIMDLALQTYKATNGRKYKLLLENYKSGDPVFAETFNTVIKEQLKTFIENNNAVYPQYKGTELQEFKAEGGRANSDDIIAIRKEIFDTTAQAIKIPLPLLYGNMTNLKDTVSQYLTFCIDPIADMLSEEITRKRYTFEEWQKGNYVRVDTTCISHMDIIDAASGLDKLVASGITNVDEMRGIIGFEALNTEFSKKHFMTKNYEPAENVVAGIDGKGVKDDAQELLFDDASR